LKEALESSKSAGLERVQSQLEEEKGRAEQLRKEVVLREREYVLLEDEVKILREQGEQRTIERDKAQLENKKLLTIINEGSKNHQLLQLQKEELMKENRELKTGKQQIASSDQAAKSELFLLREKNQAYEVQLEELRGAVHASQAAQSQL
jgi:chromosome segregation ATPase